MNKTCNCRLTNVVRFLPKTAHFHWARPARLMSGKLSRLKSKHTRKNRHASGLNENGSKFVVVVVVVVIVVAPMPSETSG